ncbi:MAG: hypothetical protein Q8Q28_04650 [Pseudomonadota bacterium]|nr:hypothetical protein [Pseudomonadota bacterium]
MIDPAHYSYRVTWSDEDHEYVGLCAEYPSLSHLAPTRDEALEGISALVGYVVADPVACVAEEGVSSNRYGNARLVG